MEVVQQESSSDHNVLADISMILNLPGNKIIQIGRDNTGATADPTTAG